MIQFVFSRFKLVRAGIVTEYRRQQFTFDWLKITSYLSFFNQVPKKATKKLKERKEKKKILPRLQPSDFLFLIRRNDN